MSILYCNDRLFLQQVKFNLPKKIKTPIGFEGLWKVAPGISYCDRTDTISVGYKTFILDNPTTYFSNISLDTFEQLCDKRSKEIFNLNTDKLFLLWSGGIDSTVALVSFLKNFSTQIIRERLTVVLTEHSIAEYPDFFEKYIKHTVPYVVVYDIIKTYKDLAKTNIVITGELGDQIFGSMLITLLSDNSTEILSRYDQRRLQRLTVSLNHETELDKLFVSWKKGIEFIYFTVLRQGNRYDIHKKIVNSLIEWLEPLVTIAPFEIMTAYDVLWWINFTLKWQDVVLRMPCSGKENAKTLFNNTIHFFCTEDFQKWSLNEKNHREEKILSNKFSSYKYIAKKYIFDFTKDNNYFLNKKKVPSLFNVSVLSENNEPIIIFDDFSFYKEGNTESRKKLIKSLTI